METLIDSDVDSGRLSLTIPPYVLACVYCIYVYDEIHCKQSPMTTIRLHSYTLCCCIRDPAYAGSTPQAIWQWKCCYPTVKKTLKTLGFNVSFQTVHWTGSVKPA